MACDFIHRCGDGGNPRTHSRCDSELHKKCQQDPEVHSSEWQEPLHRPAAHGFGTVVAPRVMSWGRHMSLGCFGRDSIELGPGAARATLSGFQASMPDSKTKPEAGKPRQTEQTNACVHVYHEASAAAAQATCTDQTLQSHRTLLCVFAGSPPYPLSPQLLQKLRKGP